MQETGSFDVIPNSPHILLINPWIHDFAAYDYWAKPLGLLMIGAALRQHGANVSYLDCLDRFHPRMPTADPLLRFGRGAYLKTRIPKPAGLKDIPRNYCRYGILPEWLIGILTSNPKPDLILVTSSMTYWYPGVQETIRTVKSVFSDIPVILGGIYATLCRDHAVRFSGADVVVSGPAESQLFQIIYQLIGWRADSEIGLDDLDRLPFQAADLQRVIPYITLLTSAGCPFSCGYCASGYLNPKRILRNVGRIVEEIQYWLSGYGVADMVFYDDALLVDSERHAALLFAEIIDRGLGKIVRFHTPNAVHIREITPMLARLMYDAGFKTLYLGFETAASNRSGWDCKVTCEEFITAVSDLQSAGFHGDQMGAYLLAGLPGQSLESIEASIEAVRKTGIWPVLAHYTPIPHTALWPAAVASSRYDLESDPIFTNNAIFPCQKQPFSWTHLARLKKLLSNC